MADDPWAEFRTTPEAQQQAPTDPWSVYRSPGTVSPVISTPGAPQSMSASPGDKYRAAAMEERDQLLKMGIPLQEGYTSRLARGAGLGWTDEIMAAGATPLEMIKRGLIDPREAYRYTKAREDLRAEQTTKNTEGVLGTGAELLGSLSTGAGVMNPSSRAIGAIPAGVVNYGANIAKAGGVGALAGAGEAKDIEGIPKGMMMGGILGAGLGATLPGVLAAGSYAAGPTIRALQFPRLRDPVKVADEHVAKVARDAGVVPEDIARQLRDARAAGQPYTVADVIGNEGARALTGMSKVPGEQRDLITQTLTERNRNMPQRVGDEVGQAFGAPGTAEQARVALLEQAERQAAPKYREAEGYPTWSNRLQEFLDDPVAKHGLRQGMEVQRLRAVGEGRPYNPRDAMITDFDAAGDPIISGVPNMQTLHTLKTGIDKMIEAEQNPVTNKLTQRGAALVAYKNGLLREMDAINPAYGEARTLYRGPMEVRDAVDIGKSMATRGRPADTLPVFERLPTSEQQGVRIGYADALREPLERTGNLPTALREKSPKGEAELAALSLYQGPRRPGEPDQLRTFLNREEQMQRTSKSALGGSPTAENLADMNAGSNVVGDVAGLIGSAASGQPLSFAQKAIGMLGSVAKGESAAQRTAIARALLERDPDMVEAMAARIAAREKRSAELLARARPNL